MSQMEVAYTDGKQTVWVMKGLREHVQKRQQELEKALERNPFIEQVRHGYSYYLHCRLCNHGADDPDQHICSFG